MSHPFSYQHKACREGTCQFSRETCNEEEPRQPQPANQGQRGLALCEDRDGLFSFGQVGNEDVEAGPVGAAAKDAFGSFLEVRGLGEGISMNCCGLRSVSGNQLLWICTMIRWPGRKVCMTSGIANWILVGLVGFKGFRLGQAVAEFAAKRLAAHQFGSPHRDGARRAATASPATAARGLRVAIARLEKRQ